MGTRKPPQKTHIFSHFPKRFSQLAKFSQKRKKAASKEQLLHATQVRFQSCSRVPLPFPSRSLLFLPLRSIERHPCFRDVLPCSPFVPFLFPRFSSRRSIARHPKLSVCLLTCSQCIPLLVRSFFTSDEYCTTPKLPCCVAEFPSCSPHVPLSLPHFFSALRRVFLHATQTWKCCVSMFHSRSLHVPSLFSSEESICTPSKLPCCGVTFPSRSSHVPSYFHLCLSLSCLLFLTFLTVVLLSVIFIY